MSRFGYQISPGFANRQGFSIGGSGQINEEETILVSNFTSGDPLDVGFSIKGNPTGLINGVEDNVNLFLDGLHAERDFLVRSATGGIALYGNTGFLLDVSGNSIIATDGSILTLSPPGGLYMTPDSIDISTNNGISVNCGGSVNMNANNDMTLTTSTINLNAWNINCNNYSMPICFTGSILADNFNYGSGGQNFENVYSFHYPIPYQFICDSPPSGYTSNIWKIEFALNCYDCSNTGDKGVALYIQFQDMNSNIYMPLTYNQDTPYAVWQNPAMFSGAHSQFQNFNWTDYVDFSSMVGTGSGNVPLTVSLYWAGDGGTSNKFNLCITLTRTNLL